MFLKKKKCRDMADINEYTSRKLKDMADSLDTLSKSFAEGINMKCSLSKEDGLSAMQTAATMVCGGCKNCNLYKSGENEDNYYMYYLIHTFDQRGILLSEDMPRLFSESCHRQNQYMEQLNHNLGRAKMNLSWKSRFLESREVVVTQFKELADIMEEFSQQMRDAVDITASVERRLKQVLRLKHLKIGRMLVLEYGNCRREAYLTLSSVNGRSITAKEVADTISKELNQRWQPSQDSKKIIYKTPSTLRFVEDSNYMMLYGVSRAVKGNGQISGDNYSFRISSAGQVVMSVADGMGSGALAAKESERVIELTEQLLDTGFSTSAALKLVNTVLLLEGNEQNPTTLDLCCVDLHSGKLEAMKLGAVATFIIHNEGVEVLETDNIPMGVLQTIEPIRLSKKLEDGEMMVMVTDGVLEAMPGNNKEQIMREFLERLQTKKPQDMADRILEFAKAQSDIPKDDMTALVTGIWKKSR